VAAAALDKRLQLLAHQLFMLAAVVVAVEEQVVQVVLASAGTLIAVLEQ
jgi:hypothetical protein